MYGKAEKEVAVRRRVTGSAGGRQGSKTVLESDGLIGELKKALAERMLHAELDVHLDHPEEQAAGNHRNGSSAKTVLTPDGALTLAIPRDRHGQFDPALIPKYQRRFPGFDTKIVALYARGMSTREIQAHISELYGLTISPELVSAVTGAVMEEVAAWQNRPVEATYAFVFFDALRVKIRNKGHFPNDQAATKLIWLALRHIEAKWKSPPAYWHAAKTQLAIQFEDRFILSQ